VDRELTPPPKFPPFPLPAPLPDSVLEDPEDV
jgi:hypothetical protein